MFKLKCHLEAFAKLCVRVHQCAPLFSLFDILQLAPVGLFLCDGGAHLLHGSFGFRVTENSCAADKDVGT